MVGVTIHPQSNLSVSFLRFRSAEPLASIWMQPCSVQMDPKEQCGFKIQVSGAVLPQPIGNLCLPLFRFKPPKAQERKCWTSLSWFCNVRARLNVRIGYAC